jgi:hypothetical protein
VLKRPAFGNTRTVIGNSMTTVQTSTDGLWTNHLRQIKRHDRTFNQQANASKKIKKPPTHEKNNLNFFANRTKHTFIFFASHKKAKPKKK